MESINGQESVKDLIDMVNRNDNTSAIITLISMTTKINRPATYNQFCKSLKLINPELYSKHQSLMNQSIDSNKGFINIFKSSESKVFEELNQNKLETMVRLIKESNMLAKMGMGINKFSDESKNDECKMLKDKFDLKKGPAIESLNRFKWGKDICNKYNHSSGAKVMQNYIDIYNLYLSKYITENK